MTRLFSLLAAICLAASANAAAQDYDSYQQRQKDLVQLASVFGDLHHIRRTCEPRYEADAWRERMKKLVDLEAPMPDARQAMVSAFNKSYRDAQRQFPSCNRRARNYAASRAVNADRLIERLTAPLYAAMTDNETFLFSETPQADETQRSNQNDIVNRR